MPVNKSQLRRLARDYASGRLEHDEYIRQRGALIDGIVAGDIVIESSAESTSDFAAVESPEKGSGPTPLPLIIGACIVIAVLWVFFAGPDGKTPRQTRPATGGQETGQRVSAARALVEEFLATRDWSGESLTAFRDSWNALTPNEQAQARAAPWFRRLAEALREEINAHKALAEFDGSGLSTTTGRRLASFGEFLGIDAEMPDPSPAPSSPTLVTEEATQLTGSQWLAAQRGEDFTLQLFAVEHLDRLEHLSAGHPDVALHLLIFEGREPRFRMVHGAFASEEQARIAHRSLPADLRGQSADPFVRRIDGLREEMRSPPAASSVPSAPPAAQGTPVYTLQVFASGSRDNADRLVARYQSLDLRVQVSEGEPTTYRVLYGRFATPEAAQAASAKLPAGMVEEVGKPLLRETTEFR
jgi:hypothetical protein